MNPVVENIHACRICGCTNLTEVFALPHQPLSGKFTASGDVPLADLTLVRCDDVHGCGLVQLKEVFDPDVLYGVGYGYRSGLNESMVEHLRSVAMEAKAYLSHVTGLVNVLDIGCNDGTLLRLLKDQFNGQVMCFGVDPACGEFAAYHDNDFVLINDYFSAQKALNISDGKKMNLVSSIAMFYDLPNPLEFFRDVEQILEDEGIWVVEQSYLPLMLSRVSFDTICHEHTEYYSLQQFQWMCDHSGLRVVSCSFNESNGGSFRLIICKDTGEYVSDGNFERFSEIERLVHLNKSDVFKVFSKNVEGARRKFMEFLTHANENGIKVAALGASTKGNILLNHFGVDRSFIDCIGEVNERKFGCVSPGVSIPIVDEVDIIGKYDYYVILPWHFKKSFLSNPKYQGLNLVFPLPEFEIVEARG